MTTEIPTQAQVDAFQNAWHKADDAGLIGMRTLAGLTAVLNLEAATPIPGWALDADFTAVTPEPKLVALIDEDGDTWVPVDGEVNSWHCPSEEYLKPRTIAEVTEEFGPLKEVRV